MSESNPTLISLGLTRYWRSKDGLRLDVGAFTKGLEYAVSKKAKVMGKPSKDFYMQALKILNTSANDTYMVGDDIVGDIAGAQAAGIHGILVKTGKYRTEDERSKIRPEFIMDSIADFHGWWLSHLC